MAYVNLTFPEGPQTFTISNIDHVEISTVPASDIPRGTSNINRAKNIDQAELDWP